MDYDPSEPLHKTRQRIEISILYHRKRERFLAYCDRIAKACSLVAATAAFQAIVRDSGGSAFSLWIVAIFTLPSLFSLVFSLSDIARRHSELAQKFIQLESEIVSTDFWSILPENISKWDEKTRLIEISEPPALSSLVSMCQNQIAIAADQPDKVINLKWYQKWFAQIFDMPLTKEQAEGRNAAQPST